MHFRLCDYVLDLVQNAVEAGADLISLKLMETSSQFILTLEDNGCGMDEKARSLALDPFYSEGSKHTARKVGLGLPLLQQALESTGGLFRLESERERGTVVSCRFDLTHMDTPPIGDVASLILQCMLLPGPFELKIERSREGATGEDRYTLSRHELQEILGNLEQSDTIIMLRKFIRSQEEDLMQGENDG